MKVVSFDPVTDARWDGFVHAHPESSVFHTREWIQAIADTYGYQPIAYTTSEGTTLDNAVVFCRVESWITGKRLVSLPFSDHCQPLASGEVLTSILAHVRKDAAKQSGKYIELRPVHTPDMTGHDGRLAESATYLHHNIDLQGTPKELYGRLHDSCIRRKIKRAEREELVYESGRSEELLQQFFQLHLLTRRRHKLPPHPIAWFRNVLESMGDMAAIHVASKDGVPAATMMTLAYKTTLVYKYGCSDGKFNNLGGTPFLFWKIIQEAKSRGMQTIDLGRSDHKDEGLIAFKGHLGAQVTELKYFRDSPKVRRKAKEESSHWLSGFAREALSRMPDSVLSGVGRLMYPHVG